MRAAASIVGGRLWAWPPRSDCLVVWQWRSIVSEAYCSDDLHEPCRRRFSRKKAYPCQGASRSSGFCTSVAFDALTCRYQSNLASSLRPAFERHRFVRATQGRLDQSRVAPLDPIADAYDTSDDDSAVETRSMN